MDLGSVPGRYIGRRINYWLDPSNRNANELTMSKPKSEMEKGENRQRVKRVKMYIIVKRMVTG